MFSLMYNGFFLRMTFEKYTNFSGLTPKPFGGFSKACPDMFVSVG